MKNLEIKLNFLETRFKEVQEKIAEYFRNVDSKVNAWELVGNLETLLEIGIDTIREELGK